MRLEALGPERPRRTSSSCALSGRLLPKPGRGLKDTPADDLVAAVLKGVLDKTGKTSLIEKKTMKKKTYEKKT